MRTIRDPKKYLESFCKIKGKTPGLSPFILNEAQKDIFNVMRKSNRILILKARQLGFSTAVTGFMYHKTITTPGTNTVLIGYNTDLAAEFLDKVKTFYRTTPDSLKPKIQYNSKYEISFPSIDSKIVVLPSSENVGRGYTISNALVSELAFWDKPEEKMLALESAVPKGGLIVVESTPQGIGNLYHRMWMAENNGYVKKEYGWWWLYNEEEIEEIRVRINDPMRFAQEYSLEFLSTGRPVFNASMVKRLSIKNILKVGDTVKNDVGETSVVIKTEDDLVIYKPPRPGSMYVAGADVAEGVTGGDYSTCTIYERSSGEEVAMYRGHISADKFGALLNKFGRMYNEALMVVEINNHGLTTITALKNLLYPKLYFRPAKFDTMGTSWSERIGWKTTKVTRPLMIDDLNEALREESLIIHSKETYDEMFTFIYDDGGNMVTSPGFHDDLIFSSAIGFQGFKVLSDKPQDQIQYEDHMPASTHY